MCFGEKVNEFVFCLDDYNYCDDPEKEMWEDIAQELNLLTKNGYVCTFECEERGIYVIQYSSDNLEFGTPIPIWMTEDDYDEYIFMKENKSDGDEDVCNACQPMEEEFNSEAKE